MKIQGQTARVTGGGSGLGEAVARALAAQWLDVARSGYQWLLSQAELHWARVQQRDAALPFV